MNVQLVRRLEGAFRVHLVPEDSNSALCGATSKSGWEVSGSANLATESTCPLCQAALTNSSVPLVVTTFPGGLSMPSGSVPPAPVEPTGPPQDWRPEQQRSRGRPWQTSQ